MRSLLFMCIVLTMLGCAGNNNISRKVNTLNGAWLPIRQEMGGKPLPSIIYEKQQLVINGLQFTLTAESIDKGDLQYKDGKMDIYGRVGVNAGKHFMAIYTLEKDQLTICYNLAGNSYPTSFETKAGTILFLAVYKKLK